LENDSELLVEEHTSSSIVIEETEIPCPPDTPHEGPHPRRSLGAASVHSVHRRLPTVILAGLVLGTTCPVGIAFLVWFRPWGQNHNRLQMRMEQRITDRNCYNVAISPDGRFIAYIVHEGGRQALRLRQIPSGSDQQKLPLDQVRYWGLAFSLDGN